MNEPISVVVSTARTPDEARILVARLRAEGIPAFTDGQLAPDEFAVSQRLMNLQAVKVRVPAAAEARAREILAEDPETPVDLDELTRQAIESRDDPDAESEQ